MSTFAFVKLINSSVDGKNEIKVNVSKIHRFQEFTHHPFQEYKIDLKNGSIGLATILFLAKSEKEMDNMIAKGMRIRTPNQKFRKDAVDTTDSELDDKRKEVVKRNYSKQPINALENRMKLLSEREAYSNNLEPAVKKCKIIVSKHNNGKDLKSVKVLHEERVYRSPMKTIDQNLVGRHAMSLPIDTETVPTNREKQVDKEFPLDRNTLLTKQMKSQNRNEDGMPEKEKSFQLGSKTTSNDMSRRKSTDQTILNRTSVSKTFMGKEANIVSDNHCDNLVFQSGTKNDVNTALCAQQSSLKNKETSFQKLMVTKNQNRCYQMCNNEEQKSLKLSAEIKKFKELLQKERQKTSEQERKINLLEDELNLIKQTLEETGKELKIIKDLNQRWQKVGINKCGIMDATINEMKKAKTIGRNDCLPPVGHITDDRSSVHMGRDEWISYNTYTLAMHGVNYKSRRLFPKNLCVGVFGYDMLSRSTVSGKGSNRNGNTKQPDERLDANKLLAIRDIYRHFLITNLNVSEEVADNEAFKVNQCISRKISSVKQLQNKPAKPTRRLVGAPVIEKGCPSPRKEIDNTIEENDMSSVGLMDPFAEEKCSGPSAEEIVVPSDAKEETLPSDELVTLSEEEEDALSEKETDPLSDPRMDSMSEAPTDLFNELQSEEDIE